MNRRRPLWRGVLFLLLLALPGLGMRGHAQTTDAALATAILSDHRLDTVSQWAMNLAKKGFNAGSGYGEIWIRDFNTFMELSCRVLPKEAIAGRLSVFFQMQGDDGNIIDGYIPKEKANVGYQYIYSKQAPAFAGHKNTVETDQESSLIQAVYKYVNATGDHDFLQKVIAGKSVMERMGDALEFLMKHRFDAKHGLIYGATTADWGDVQPEGSWGVTLDSTTHYAIDIYDNAMLVIALNNYLSFGAPKKDQHKWQSVKKELVKNIRRYLWDPVHQKFIPHVYLDGSPFPADFDENSIYYHGGTAVAIEAGILSPDEIAEVNKQMLANVKASGALSIGLTVYPPYPKGFFKNQGMYPYGYQNGGDWTWFGARMIRQLIRYGFLQEAYTELNPMIDRVLKNKDFYEWYTVDGKPAGSGNFRGSAGELYATIAMLREWAEKQHR